MLAGDRIGTSGRGRVVKSGFGDEPSEEVHTPAVKALSEKVCSPTPDAAKQSSAPTSPYSDGSWQSG